MIKIIKHGSYRTCSCYNCGCIFTFEEDDVTTEFVGTDKYTRGVQCPDCGARNTVDLTGGWGTKPIKKEEKK